MRRIELPPGSGRAADYEQEEEEMMREILLRDGGSGEVFVLHELKVEFDVHLVRSMVE